MSCAFAPVMAKVAAAAIAASVLNFILSSQGIWPPDKPKRGRSRKHTKIKAEVCLMFQPKGGVFRRFEKDKMP
jgi:predicted alpha/beta-hydrolase family hydrolase